MNRHLLGALLVAVVLVAALIAYAFDWVKALFGGPGEGN